MNGNDSKLPVIDQNLPGIDWKWSDNNRNWSGKKPLMVVFFEPFLIIYRPFSHNYRYFNDKLTTICIRLIETVPLQMSRNLIYFKVISINYKFSFNWTAKSKENVILILYRFCAMVFCEVNSAKWKLFKLVSANGFFRTLKAFSSVAKLITGLTFYENFNF